MGAEALTVAVDIEFDCCCWNYTCQAGSEASEKGSPAFCLVYVSNYSERLVVCV